MAFCFQVLYLGKKRKRSKNNIKNNDSHPLRSMASPRTIPTLPPRRPAPTLSALPPRHLTTTLYPVPRLHSLPTHSVSKGPQSPPTPPGPTPTSSSSGPPSLSSKRDFSVPEIQKSPKKRLENLESWSMVLERGTSGEKEVSAMVEEEEWTADLSQLFIGHKFASGANSRIYRGIYKQRAVAIKMVKMPEQDEETRTRLEEEFKAEVSLLTRLWHPSIVQIIAACRKPPVYCIITEYMSQGTLRMYLHKKDPYSLPAETILRFALDISRGMQYLHSQGVIHRDLKSDNLLLNDEMQVKVSDLGTSCLETNLRETKGNMGTYRWMAPEMIKEKPYSKKVDVYSFGIVLWELTTALVPFQGMTPIQAAYAASEKNLRPILSTVCPTAINDLIQKCWAANPDDRPDFYHIVSVLEKYDACIKDGLPLDSQTRLQGRLPFIERIKGCMSIGTSTRVQA